MSESEKIPVAILGSTGMVGQRFLSLLDDHPRFRVTQVLASSRSAGMRYAEATRWGLPTEMPAWARDLVVGDANALPDEGRVRLAFSALDASVAREVEATYAEAGIFVVSNASAYRMDPEVPLVVPEVNADHLDLVRSQRFGQGGIVCNPNCSTIGLVLALAPLHRAFGVEEVAVTTLQAASGAGYPGVPSLDLIDNVVPFISGEEEKLALEPAKILGTLEGDARGIAAAQIVVSPQCFRVPVIDGHTLSVSVRLAGDPGRDEVLRAWQDAAQAVPLRYTSAADRPQPRLDRDFSGGMGITIGRLRPCPVLGFRFVALSHNTVRGAAGGAIATAEAVLARGLLQGGSEGR
ncbi:Aspartate-semialdehyde dehydrogenase [Planctomycetes bacterium Poly30]|uniref:aspartate-semialdehyde dehydrogenase n=1 Tax=Saltatorellus ferox TaxID=2528018 RepID=A0A518EXL6_9BACT|nr:Aspartate-semialdehyde dehydrogenase [Planctomycetes bacterium Poly30]